MTAECLCVIPVTANAQVSHHTSTTLLYYLQPWAFIRIPNIILVCVATPLRTRHNTQRVTSGKYPKRAVIVAVLASKINKYIYLNIYMCVCILNGIEFSQLRSRRPNIDYTGLERFSVRGLLDWVQKRVKGTSTYVIASDKCHTYAS